MSLDAARSSSGFGANPISFAEMRAWSLLTGNRPTPWEVKVLKALDHARLETLLPEPAKPALKREG